MACILTDMHCNLEYTHSWIHDFCSGEQVGQLLLEVPPSVQASGLTKDKLLSDLLDDGSQKQTVEFSSGPVGNPVRDFCSINKVTIRIELSSLFLFVMYAACFHACTDS